MDPNYMTLRVEFPDGYDERLVQVALEHAAAEVEIDLYDADINCVIFDKGGAAI